jgi:hypothetical protein
MFSCVSLPSLSHLLAISSPPILQVQGKEARKEIEQRSRAKKEEAHKNKKLQKNLDQTKRSIGFCMVF